MSAQAVKELDEYRMFTTPSELHKAINTLRGIVAGITMESGASDAEMQELANWCSLHKHLEKKHPFSEILPLVYAAQEDGIIDTDEAMNILWLCNNFLSELTYYDEITCALQYLAGLLHGILSDNALSDKELKMLREWLDAHDFLRGCYPFDEIDSLLMSVLADGIIEDDERDMLKAFFSQFVDTKASINLNEIELNMLRDKYNVSGVCAACPDIDFKGNQFCFTGQSRKAKRSDIAEIVKENGGIFNNNVTQNTKYLIVGNAGNPCWAYACYSRKIEEAVAMRKQGHKIIIVNETDFWDAVD